jgi:GNAT superfamily N-acetyltransferase
MNIEVRCATRNDLEFVAWCNYEASSPAPGYCYWDSLLEGSQTETMTFIQALLRTDALAFGSIENFFVVTQDGQAVAGASGFEMNPNDYRPIRLGQFEQTAVLLGWSQSQQAHFLELYNRVWHNPTDVSLAPSAPWVIECVAVKPEARGQGMTRKLFAAIHAEGRRLGHRYTSIAVTTGNTAATRAYEANGFELFIQYGAAYFEHQFPGTSIYRFDLATIGDTFSSR